ncbi:hypothetical protein [Halarsenatibacter silvermanii]|uniref:Phosphohydrolase n=1 Tax=Halarsenatibacter silvermanii TaxID=321763 RepID=A0A1G9KY80_9FIRM|nr:hypothetical protein [Halarsenatibacter silvermanii]SDL54589.1 hypothetical protein SAMN04488692_105128 [Halarsenatibacter silvermanii]
MFQQCPGQDGRSWSPDDVNEKDCPVCGYEVEFFKFDLLRPCPECGKDIINPGFNLGCAEWCDQAANCIGEGSTLYSEVQTLREKVEEKIERLLQNNPEKLVLVKELTEIADEIGKLERYSPLSVILSGLLFPLGDPDCDPASLNIRGLKELDDPKIEIASLENCAEIAHIILNSLDIPDRYRQEVMRNIKAIHQKKKLKNTSYLVLKDACSLALYEKGQLQELEIREELITEGGKKLAEREGFLDYPIS